jgi:hypothetical protein
VRQANETAVLSNDQLSYIAGTEFVPQGLRGNLPAILACVATGRALGIPDITALRSIHIIDGKATYSAELMVMLVRKQGHSITGEVAAGAATVVGTRKDNGDTMTVTWTLEMAERAGLLGKQNWRKYPESMLWARAASQLCRMLFADCFAGGTYTPEEIGAEFTDSVGEPEADAVRGGREPVSVAQPVLDGDAVASPTDTGTEGGGGSPSVDLSDPDIPFGDAPPDPPKPSAAQIKKLNVLVKAVGPESLAERFGPTLLPRVYATIADIRGWTTDELVNTIGGKDAEGTLRWSPLRDALSKHEAHELIERLEKIEAHT